MQHSPTHTEDPVEKAIAMLDMLEPEVREQVLSKMAPDARERIENRISTMPAGAAPSRFSQDIAARRKLLREAGERMQGRRVSKADETGEQILMSGTTPGEREFTPNGDPLAPLGLVHPAALARAMQGERAEAWALVFGRLDANTRGALELYLDGEARTAILDAERDQGSMPGALRNTIEKAIASTVVPRALREHQLLISNRHGAL